MLVRRAHAARREFGKANTLALSRRFEQARAKVDSHILAAPPVFGHCVPQCFPKLNQQRLQWPHPDRACHLRLPQSVRPMPPQPMFRPPHNWAALLAASKPAPVHTHNGNRKSGQDTCMQCCKTVLGGFPQQWRQGQIQHQHQWPPHRRTSHNAGPPPLLRQSWHPKTPLGMTPAKATVPGHFAAPQQ